MSSWLRLVLVVLFMGLTARGAAEAGATASRRAAGYRTASGVGPLRIGLRAQSWELSEAFGGAGGLRSTLDGMLGYLAANMQRRQTPPWLGDRAGAAGALPNQPEPRNGTRVGAQPAGGHRADRSPAQRRHRRFRSFLGFTDDGQFGVVVLANTRTPVDGLALRLLATIVDGSA